MLVTISMLVTEIRCNWHLLDAGPTLLVPNANFKRSRMLLTETAKIFINSSKLSPTDCISNSRHQHRWSHIKYLQHPSRSRQISVLSTNQEINRLQVIAFFQISSSRMTWLNPINLCQPWCFVWSSFYEISTIFHKRKRNVIKFVRLAIREFWRIKRVLLWLSEIGFDLFFFTWLRQWFKCQRIISNRESRMKY